jgi:hypothetical protein
MNRIRLSILLLTLICLPAFAADDVVPGTVYTDATFVHIGLRWQIAGDDDLDAVCTVRYRQAGAQTWQDGMDLFRAHTNLSGQGGLRPENRFAGSLFFLEPGTSYEIELTLTDPDGGGSTQTVTASTETPMAESAAADHYYAEPGDGGGSGTQADPFRGLQAACDAVSPGAIIHAAAGVYDAFELITSGEPDHPIVLRGPADPHTETDESQWALVDGADTDRGVLTLGTYDRRTSHIIIEQMVIQNGRWGIDAQNTYKVMVRNNIIRDVGFGYYNRRDNGLENRQYISDNTLIGRTPWPGSGIPSERGIDLRGSGNVACYNRVRNFGDGVSIQPFTDAYGYANDIYGNDISEIVDDPIEIDYNSCNTRVWRNRVINARMGVSLAPIYGGPVYIFRNVFFNLESSAYKMNREPAGLVILHNTSAKLGNGTSSDDGWQNTLLRNNIILGTRYVFEEYGLVAGSIDDWDYDALGTTGSPFAKWDNVRYANLESLRQASGIEAHAVAITLEDLVEAMLPDDYAEGVVSGSFDLQLKAGTDAINAGQVLTNINDPFVSDGQPDCGAYEYGQPLPQYGPRTGRDDPDGAPDPNDDSNDTDGSGASGGGCFIQMIASCSR